jgi:hypothetical protein
MAAGLLMPLAAFGADQPPPAPTIPVATRLDNARTFHAKGDLARTALELEAAIAEIRTRLGRALADFLPAIPVGWQAEPPETQDMASAGGGMAVTRAYGREDNSLNATLVLDSPAVATAASQMAASAAPQPNIRRLKVGNDDALLRWDAATRSGDITLVLGSRVLLQIEGDNLGTSDVLIEAARTWNVAGIRKYLGL